MIRVVALDQIQRFKIVDLHYCRCICAEFFPNSFHVISEMRQA